MLFIVLYKVLLTFKSMYEILKCDHPNTQINATEQYFPLLLFMIMYIQYMYMFKLRLTFESLDQIIHVYSIRRVGSNISLSSV